MPEMAADAQMTLVSRPPFSASHQSDDVRSDDPNRHLHPSVRALVAAHAAVDSADDAFLDIAPTSIAGVAAVLAYAADFVCRTGGDFGGQYEAPISPCGFKKKHGVNWEVVLHDHLARALTAIAAAA
jgi:hypothetical protein